MVIYGSNTKPINNIKSSQPCPACHKSNCMDTYVIQEYALIFWVPFIPTSKTTLCVCSSSEEIIDQKDLTDKIDDENDALLKKTKAPYWTFTGLGIVLIFVVSVLSWKLIHDSNNGQTILKPKVDDVFEIELADNSYTLYKVKSVIGDSVYLLINEYETNERSGLMDLYEKEFLSETYVLSKSDLKNMFDEGVILDIQRD